MSKLSKLFTPILVLSGLLLLMVFTNPYELHFAVLIVPFFLFGAFIFLAMRLVLIDVFRFRTRPSTLASAVLALVCVFILSLSSLRQLTILDFVLTLSFAALISWYVKRYFFSG